MIPEKAKKSELQTISTLIKQTNMTLTNKQTNNDGALFSGWTSRNRQSDVMCGVMCGGQRASPWGRNNVKNINNQSLKEKIRKKIRKLEKN